MSTWGRRSGDHHLPWVLRVVLEERLLRLEILLRRLHQWGGIGEVTAVLASVEAFPAKVNSFHPPFALNAVTKTIDAQGGETAFTYDANRNLLTLSDALTHSKRSTKPVLMQC